MRPATYQADMERLADKRNTQGTTHIACTWNIRCLPPQLQIHQLHTRQTALTSPMNCWTAPLLCGAASHLGATIVLLKATSELTVLGYPTQMSKCGDFFAHSPLPTRCGPTSL